MIWPAKRRIAPPASRCIERVWRRAEGDAGFTLIEVLIVLAVLGLATGLVLGRGPRRGGTPDVRAAASEVAQVLRGARGRAIASDAPVSVLFGTVPPSLRVGTGPVRALPAGVSLAVVAAGGEGAAITFLPDGSSTGGRVELTGAARRVQVGVDWLTGRVVVADGP